MLTHTYTLDISYNCFIWFATEISCDYLARGNNTPLALGSCVCLLQQPTHLFKVTQACKRHLAAVLWPTTAFFSLISWLALWYTPFCVICIWCAFTHTRRSICVGSNSSAASSEVSFDCSLLPWLVCLIFFLYFYFDVSHDTDFRHFVQLISVYIFNLN